MGAVLAHDGADVELPVVRGRRRGRDVATGVAPVRLVPAGDVAEHLPVIGDRQRHGPPAVDLLDQPVVACGRLGHPPAELDIEPPRRGTCGDRQRSRHRLDGIACRLGVGGLQLDPCAVKSGYGAERCSPHPEADVPLQDGVHGVLEQHHPIGFPVLAGVRVTSSGQ